MNAYPLEIRVPENNDGGCDDALLIYDALKFSIVYVVKWSVLDKEIVERRHGEPIKFLFLPKMGLLGRQAGNEKNCWLWIMSNFWGLFFHVFMGKNLNF